MSLERISGGRFPTYMRQSLLPAGPRTMPLDIAEGNGLAGKFAADKRNTATLGCAGVYAAGAGMSPIVFERAQSGQFTVNFPQQN